MSRDAAFSPCFVGFSAWALMRDGMVAALPRRHRNVPKSWCSTPRKEEDGEMKDMMIGVDLAKNVFQVHGA
ncbi:MAG: hypothetical protein II336_01315, partial [Loktanella sp.]|nr:hypothetical protein [Loktanella sp.]